MTSIVRQRLLWPESPALPPANRTDTSKSAADSVASAAPRRRELVLALIRGRGDRGATIDEIQIATGWLTQSICPRVNELAKKRMICDSGKRRKTRAGRAAIVWVAACNEERRHEGS